jgi:hypothetical protein
MGFCWCYAKKKKKKDFRNFGIVGGGGDIEVRKEGITKKRTNEGLDGIKKIRDKEWGELQGKRIKKGKGKGRGEGLVKGCENLTGIKKVKRGS